MKVLHPNILNPTNPIAPINIYFTICTKIMLIHQKPINNLSLILRLSPEFIPMLPMTYSIIRISIVKNRYKTRLILLLYILQFFESNS